MRTPRPEMTKRSQSGFALIMALLTLLVLTFLGLALATTTTTELQIGYNYKWGQQAFYNAEAGVELAKRFLRQQTWSTILPRARDFAEMPTTAVTTLWTMARENPTGTASRNFENSNCETTLDGNPSVGFGVVLDHASMTVPFQNISDSLGQQLGGAFTAWVRRPVVYDAQARESDEKLDSILILTVEGVAPYTGVQSGLSFAQRNRAVRYLEVELQKVDPADCENDFTGQTGMGALGANYDPCYAVTEEGVGRGTGTTVTEINPNT